MYITLNPVILVKNLIETDGFFDSPSRLLQLIEVNITKCDILVINWLLVEFLVKIREPFDNVEGPESSFQY